MRTLITLLLSVMSAWSLVAGTPSRGSVSYGTAVSLDRHAIVVGEAVSGNIGSSGDYHVTHGQLQGVAVVVPAQESIVETLDELSDYRFYPNPATDVLNIDLGTVSDAEVVITAMNGLTVTRMTGCSEHIAIDVTSLARGIYLLTITNKADNSQFTAKIIKN